MNDDVICQLLIIHAAAQARQAVVLPYEQAQQTVGEMRGDGTAYGRVHYIRDSDSNADSDEDPDDDLDI